MPDDRIEKAKGRLLKARAALARFEREDKRRARRERDTALFTLGACYAVFHESEDPEKRYIASKIWSYFETVAPLVLSDARGAALQNVFGLVKTSSSSTEENVTSFK